jgi:thioredoxin 1
MKMADVLEVTDATFQAEILESSVPAVVDFWAEWCGPCKAIAPLVGNLAVQYDGQVKVAKLNVDDSPETAVRYRVQAIPTLIAYKNGEVLSQIRGPRRNDLEKFFAEVAAG